MTRFAKDFFSTSALFYEPYDTLLGACCFRMHASAAAALRTGFVVCLFV